MERSSGVGKRWNGVAKSRTEVSAREKDVRQCECGWG